MNIWDVKEDIIDTNKFCIMLDDLKANIDSSALSMQQISDAIKGISIMLGIHINKTLDTCYSYHLQKIDPIETETTNV
jgi:hypothetical protein